MEQEREAQVRVDPARCQGHNRCVALCPEVFDTDDLGYAVVTKPVVGADLMSEVRLAEENCPERAITVTRA